MYIVSSLGVTGTRSEIRTDLASIVKVGAGKHQDALRHRLRHLHPGAGRKDGRHRRWRHRWLCHHQAAGTVRHRHTGTDRGLCQTHEGCRKEIRVPSCCMKQKRSCCTGLFPVQQLLLVFFISLPAAQPARPSGRAADFPPRQRSRPRGPRRRRWRSPRPGGRAGSGAPCSPALLPSEGRW